MNAVIVSGAQGCGKTTNAELLKSHFKLNNLVDDYAGGDVEVDTLYLTNLPLDGAISFNDAMHAIQS